MTSDGRTLKQLSEATRQGAWRLQGLDGTVVIDVDTRQMNTGHPHELARFGNNLDARLAVAVVNAYREGRLVEAPAKQTCSHGNSPHCYPFCYEPDPSSVTETPK